MTAKDSHILINNELLTTLFRDKIVQIDQKILKSLRVNSLECIVRLFVMVNEGNGKVVDQE